VSLAYKNVHVIINPATGRAKPILNVLKDVFHQSGIDWEVNLPISLAMRLARPKMLPNLVWRWSQLTVAMAPRW
jgi:hypothetical protein